MKSTLKGCLIGLQVAVDYWEIVVFNRRLPRGICWLIMMIIAPISAIYVSIVYLFNRNVVNETFDGIINDLKEREAE